MIKKTDEEARVDAKAKAGDILGTNTEIGRKLKQYYDEILSEDVPDKFSLLLEQLEKVETSGKAK